MPAGSASRRCTRTRISGFCTRRRSKRTPNKLGQFFVEWGVRLDSKCVGTYCKPKTPIRIYVNGKEQKGDPRQILLRIAPRSPSSSASRRAKIPATWPKSATL